MASDLCPVYAPFFSTVGCAAAIVFANFGASYGTAKSGIGVMAAGVLRPENMIKSANVADEEIGFQADVISPTGLTPIIMAGILSIYGLVMSIQIATRVSMQPSPLALSFVHFGAGLATGLSALAAGFSIGIVGDAGVRAMAQQQRLFVAMVLILIFAEVLGLYGLIVGLLLLGNTNGVSVKC